MQLTEKIMIYQHKHIIIVVYTNILLFAFVDYRVDSRPSLPSFTSRMMTGQE